MIGLESLRRFAVFVLGRHLPPPKIGTGPGGLAHAAWWADSGIMSMDFLPSGMVRFAAILEDGGWKTSGVLPPDHMLVEIEPIRKALNS